MRKILTFIIAVFAVVAISCDSGVEQRRNENVARILAETDDMPSPYDLHFDSMPDDGCIKMKINGVGGTLGRVFNDSNYLHYAAAEDIGITPIYNIAELRRLRRPLVKIASCREYYVDELTHSYPYLVPEAADLLKEIGARFNDSLSARGGGSYRLKITSVLRTPATVNKLRRVNRNATDSSAHQFATTFDISYAKFICDSLTVNRTQEDLKNLLGEVLLAVRGEGKCYVKYERKQGCFHITARKPAE
ncbi:MAG: DUF5715 family protein [Muribaculaceae bacterium]